MIEILKEKLGERVKEDELMSKHTHFRIGGRAKYFFDAETTAEFENAVRVGAELGLQIFILGGGSNILISDNGFNGLVIKASNREYKIEDDVVEVGVGMLSSLFARKMAEAGLSGFEWAVSLPGTIGGAVCGNSGCFGGETKDNLISVRVLEIENGKVVAKELSKNECQFGYRNSVFKHLNPTPAILSAKFSFKKDDAKKCLATVDEKLQARKISQPLESSSAGCMFKNFEFKDRNEVKKLESKIAVPDEFLKSGRIPAGWIIDQLGLKGEKIGDAQISEKHGNFILNIGNAKASDVAQLIDLIKLRAKDEFNIDLHEEVQFVGFDW